MQCCRPWVVIPVKDFVNAKQRLSGVLSSSERRALSQAMVEDMLARLQSVAGLQGVLLVSDDPGAELLAFRYGARVIEQDRGSRGLNAAVAQAARWLVRQGASHMLVLHGDLPGMQAADVAALTARLGAAGQPEVWLVPDRAGEGTNGLLCSLPAPIDFHYGGLSLRAHAGACAVAGVPVEEVPLTSLELDVDTPADLLRLASIQGLGLKTARFLDESQVVARLRQMRRATDQRQRTHALSPTGKKHAH